MSDFFSTATTERVDSRFADIDTLPTLELARLMNAEDRRVAPAVGEHLPEIAAAVDRIVERRNRGGRLVYVGAGTAGRLGVLDASECPPTFSTDPGEVVGIIAGGAPALTTAVENAEDDQVQARADIAARQIGPCDAVVGISASGRTPYTIAAVVEARTRGAFTVGLAGNAGSALAAAADLGIEVVTGPELVSGSTRLKAGTVQKLVLNMLSTLTMVRAGKTLGSYMIDVTSTNEKLRARARRIVTEVTGVSEADAQDALQRAHGSVKTAILMILVGLSADAASSELARHGGRLRDVLQQHTPDSRQHQH